MALARALVNHPSLLLADDPKGEMDTAPAQQIMGLLLRLNKEIGQTIILVTRDPAVARRPPASSATSRMGRWKERRDLAPLGNRPPMEP